MTKKRFFDDPDKPFANFKKISIVLALMVYQILFKASNPEVRFYAS
jgi:hypothetical protein